MKIDDIFRIGPLDTDGKGVSRMESEGDESPCTRWYCLP